MTDREVDKEVDKLQLAILAVYDQSKSHMSGTLSMLCSTIGSMLAHIASDERGLLDGIDLAHKHILTALSKNRG